LSRLNELGDELNDAAARLDTALRKHATREAARLLDRAARGQPTTWSPTDG
jgi:hypothetical protein